MPSRGLNRIGHGLDECIVLLAIVERSATCPESRLYGQVTRSSFLSVPILVSRRLYDDISRPKTKKADSEKVRDLSETGRQRTLSWHQISYTAPEKKQV